MNNYTNNAKGITAISTSACLAMSLLLSGCGSDGSKEQVVSNEEEYTHQVPAAKKGAAFSNDTAKLWSNQTAELKAHWNYDWSLNEDSKYQPDSIEFVSMKWGGSPLTDDELLALQEEAAAATAAGKVKYLLGFNEPDGAEQANMTVDEALVAWEQLKLIENGIKLVSPATVDPLGDWMQSFMEQATDVDYVAMHWYGGANAEAFLAKVDAVYNAYGKPIWITEFAVADWDAALAVDAVEDDPATLDVDETAAAIPAVANKYSEQQVIDFMKAVLPALDENDNVFRYSWFSVRPDADNYHNLASSALFGARDLETGDTTMTDLGSVYWLHTPNGYAGFGKTPPLVDLVPGNLIENGHFENGNQHWGTWFASVQEETDAVPAFNGVKYGRINDKYNGEGSLVHIIQTPLEAGRTYQLNYQARWSDGNAGQVFKVQVKINNDKRPLFEPLQTTVEGDWAYNEHTFTIPDDETHTGTYKVIFYHWLNYTGFFYLDEVVLLDVTDEIVE